MDSRNFFNEKFFKLNQAIIDVVDNFSMLNFQQLNVDEEESVQDLQITIDNMVQYDENRMPNDKHFMDQREEPDEKENEAEFGAAASQQMQM